MTTQEQIREFSDWMLIIHLQSNRDLLRKFTWSPAESEIIKDNIAMYKEELVRRRDQLTAVIEEREL